MTRACTFIYERATYEPDFGLPIRPPEFLQSCAAALMNAILFVPWKLTPVRWILRKPIDRRQRLCVLGFR